MALCPSPTFFAFCAWPLFSSQSLLSFVQAKDVLASADTFQKMLTRRRSAGILQCPFDRVSAGGWIAGSGQPESVQVGLQEASIAARGRIQTLARMADRSQPEE